MGKLKGNISVKDIVALAVRLSATCALLLPLLLMGGCREPSSSQPMNAVYYWRTEWHLDSTERAFLEAYHIQKIYCRYFDVVMRDGEPMPNATIAFVDAVPEGVELVPTVFITEDCMHEEHDSLAQKIIQRLLQMNATHGVGTVHEVQLDCDFTDRSRHVFYRFIEAVRRETAPLGIRLSATIRLHQLAMAPPPVDEGVLMLYNTGDPRKFEQRNPVLDRRDVQPYVHRLANYDLPLAAAYPVYTWQRTIYGVRIEHSVTAEELLAVKAMVERQRPDLSRRIILYCLDKKNINRYSPDDYETFYHH